ncbi:MAG: helix-turn-helix domain-containing protein, partial [Bacteroidota bacterium]
KFLVISLIVLITLSSFSLVFQLDALFPAQSPGTLGNALLCIFVIILGYWGIQQTPVLLGQSLEKANPTVVNSAASREASSATTKLDKDTYWYQKLLVLLEEQKLYLNPHLTLGSLAEELGIPAYRLSQLLSTKAGQRFFDFINAYRVKVFKNKVQRGDHLEKTLLSIAFECGFNSKAAFNRAFKKLEGTTPSAYVKSL